MVKLNINKEDLELMNYNDIAYAILENTNTKASKMILKVLKICFQKLTPVHLYKWDAENQVVRILL